MPKFNFLLDRTTPKREAATADRNTPNVRTRAVGRDRYAGLKGAAYINARAAEKIRRNSHE
jgi:hypothetical protein